MKPTVKGRDQSDAATIRVLGRGVRAERGVRLSLRSLREAAGRTQADVSAASGMDQADVSRLEAKEVLDESLVSTLQRYLAAIGATLELTAVFGDKKITVVGITPATPAARVRKATKPSRR